VTSEIPTQFTHSYKLEETTKGIRISVHVYTNENIGFYYDKKIKSG
jgi:hypothetical protein